MSSGKLSDEVQETLARLILAAREDEEFRNYVLAILRLPESERVLAVAQAMQQMKENDEPETICNAFQMLGNSTAADVIIAAINAP
jgi:hypothetical protein